MENMTNRQIHLSNNNIDKVFFSNYQVKLFSCLHSKYFLHPLLGESKKDSSEVTNFN